MLLQEDWIFQILSMSLIMIYLNKLKILFIELAEPDEQVRKDKLGVMLQKVIIESGEKLKKFYILEKKHHLTKVKRGMTDHSKAKNDLAIIENLSHVIEVINLKIKILKKKIKVVLKIKNQNLVKILNSLNEKKKQLNVLIKEINLSQKKDNFIF